MPLTIKEVEEIVENMRYRLITHTFPVGGVPNNIPHGLNRIPRRWPVAKISANSVVYGTADGVNLVLTASAPCTVTLEVA